jgi:hypothetical protein
MPKARVIAPPAEPLQHIASARFFGRVLPAVKSQRRRQTLLSMTRLEAAWESERQARRPSSAPMHILDSQPWTKTASSVKCRRSARQAGHIPTNLRRDLMRKVTLTLAIAVLFAGSAVLTADAQTSRGANNIAGAAQNFTPIEPAACRGWGPYCRPGFTRVCGRFRCWCRPCW